MLHPILKNIILDWNVGNVADVQTTGIRFCELLCGKSAAELLVVKRKLLILKERETGSNPRRPAWEYGRRLFIKDFPVQYVHTGHGIAPELRKPP